MAAVATAHPLRAQLVPLVGSRPAILSLGVAGGFTVPTKNADTPTRVGPNGQTYVLVHIPGLPPLRFNVGYQKQTFRDVLGVPSLPGGPSTGATLTTVEKDRSRQMLSAVGGITLPLFHLGPVSPYLTAGLGAFHVHTPADTAVTAAAGSTTPLVATAPSQSSVSFGVDGGAGLSLALGRVAAFAEGRVQNVYSDHGAIKSARQIKAVPVALGFSVGLF
ncbi:hypothetical protein tb265_39890 [Gemmatimonadetes bacterium T265]|nr:hypothetical protein tb265_39890 [Gemmatimonadetes bacterium T265]